MQIKAPDTKTAAHTEAQTQQAHALTKTSTSDVAKTQDAHKQAEAQQDAGKNWAKFAAAKPDAHPAAVDDKHVEAGKEASRLDIQSKLRENAIKA
jgi:hypothetical protein